MFLLYTIFKKCSNQRSVVNQSVLHTLSRVRFYIISISLLLMLLLISEIAKTQHLKLNYTIKQGEDTIGWMKLEKKVAGNTSILSLISEIKTRVVFMINVSANEYCTFQNGQLIYSSQFRKTNGTIKLNKKTRFVADKYEVLENEEKETLSFAYIGANLLSMYFEEPVAINAVYCETRQCFMPVSKSIDGGYKIKFPDGNSNSYYYTKGACTKIKISHTFYSVVILLNHQ